MVGDKEFTFDFHETTDGEHGRIELRRYYTTDDIEWLGADAEYEKTTDLKISLSLGKSQTAADSIAEARAML